MKMKHLEWALAFSAALLVAGCTDDRGPTSGGSPTGPPPITDGGLAFYKADDIAFVSPTRLAITHQGEAVVADPRARLVAAVEPYTGDPKLAFRVAGKPTSVTTIKNRVFVGNGENASVEEFDQNGHFRRRFGSGVIGYPQDVAADDIDELVFVLDGQSREVHVFDRDGSYQGSVVGPGFGASGLETPVALTVDAVRQEILVSDYGPDGGAAAVKIFSYGGTSLGSISGAGSCGMLGCSGGFSRPQSVAVDPTSGHLFLVDALLGEVVVLDRATASVIGSFGSRDDGLRPLRLPLGVGVGKDGEVYVVSNRAARVMRYESAEVPR